MVETAVKLKAAVVQDMLAVEDEVVIAHGYTLDRKTLNIFFHDGKLVREEVNREEPSEYEESDEFDPEFFFKDVKRWYIGIPNAAEPGKGLNEDLANLFETFGRPLSTTSGGFYP